MYAPDLPAPILFHPFKHHLGFILDYIAANRQIGTQRLKADLLTLGSSQLDLYLGTLTPIQIANEVIAQLSKQRLLSPRAFSRYLQASNSGYRCLTLTDNTDWILRWGVMENRFVHLHPARYATHTIRVKAAAIKTAIAVSIASAQLNLPPAQLQTINRVRVEWLGLSPVKWVSEREGIGRFLHLLLQKYKSAPSR